MHNRTSKTFRPIIPYILVNLINSSFHSEEFLAYF